MSDLPSTHQGRPRYQLAFLTNEWEWERELAAETLDQARAAAREQLETVVREEAPTLACVTILEDGVRIGVWDWVDRQAHWTRL